MTWYSTGTVKTTANSAVVTGTGTAWTNSGLRSGDMLLIGYSTISPRGYEIKSIDSATQITLVLPFPVAVNGAGYVGIPMLGGDRTSISMTLANQVTKALADTEAMSAAYQTFYTSPGTVNLTLPGGLVVTGSSFSKLTSDTNSKLGQISGYVQDCNSVLLKGIYSANSSTANKPAGITSGGWLFVYEHQATGNILQEYNTATPTTSQQDRVFIRSGSSGSWSAWSEIYTTKTKPSLSELGLGSAATKNTGTAVGTLRLIGDPATGIGSVYDYSTAFMVMSTRGQTTFFPGSGQGTIINIPLINNSAYSSRWIGDSSGRAFFQNFANSVLSDAFEICLIGKSVTVDGNGFIKKSSPIARLSYDPKKMQQDFTDGFRASGAVSVNEEAEGVSGDRLDVGVYLVEGCEGLADEGWTVEIPQDVNGNRLIFVETEVQDNGDITVRTFKRRFDPDSAMIVAGEPMDIPEGRWVDLRLKMPQKLHVVDSAPIETEQ